MLRRCGKIATLCFAVFSLCGSAAEATVIFQDNFESEDGYPYPPVGFQSADAYASFQNWNVNNGSVDLVSGGDPYGSTISGGNTSVFVDLDGSTGQAGTLVSTSLFLAAGEYLFQFDMAGNQRGFGADQINFGLESGLLSDSLTLNSNAGWATYQYSFSVLSGQWTSIFFHNIGGDNVGALLDNVILTADLDDPVVPEPMTLALVGSGFLGLVKVRQQRREVEPGASK